MFIKELVLQTHRQTEKIHMTAVSHSQNCPYVLKHTFIQHQKPWFITFLLINAPKMLAALFSHVGKYQVVPGIIIMQVKAQIIQFWEYFGHFTPVNKITISSGQSNCCSRLMDKTWDTTDSKNFKFQKFMEGFAGIPRPLKYIRI